MAVDNPDIVGMLIQIYSNKTKIIVGETIDFTVNTYGVGESTVSIYIDDDIVYQTQGSSTISYSHTFNQTGNFTVYAQTTNPNLLESQVINVNVKGDFRGATINNKTVSSLQINNKQVKSIVMDDNIILYYNEPELELSLSSDENILSYTDGDTCTLTAQLMNGNNPALVEGVTVEFFKDPYTSLGFADTDANGIATKVFSPTEVGDITFFAEISDRLISSNRHDIRVFTRIVDTINGLTDAFVGSNIGDRIYLKNGTYSIPNNYSVSGILLVGESTSAKIVSTDGYITFVDSTIENIGMETVNVNRPVIQIDGVSTVIGCDCVSDLKPWDATVIMLTPNNPDASIEICNCYFHGNARSNGYGHTCSAITVNGSSLYNVSIHHNIFDHPCNSSQKHGSDKGKAVVFYNGNNLNTVINNVHLYCNSYNGCGDTNLGVTEGNCPDN